MDRSTSTRDRDAVEHKQYRTPTRQVSVSDPVSQPPWLTLTPRNQLPARGWGWSFTIGARRHGGVSTSRSAAIRVATARRQAARRAVDVAATRPAATR